VVFHDSPEGMLRFREQTTETAGIYNTVGFNDDTRAFLSIPARHDVARRVDCSFLARWVAEQRLDEDEAVRIAEELTYRLPKAAYRLQARTAGLSALGDIAPHSLACSAAPALAVMECRQSV
jgi:glucuronate isomerase